MYKIQSVKINNFWHRFNASGEFNKDVNIIIGRNGTGKTTFMNILHSVLAVDIDGISTNDFDSVVVVLVNGEKTKTIKINKIERDDAPYLMVDYQISQKKYCVRIISSEGIPTSHRRRRAMEESQELREDLSKLVSLSSLSVYRLRSSQDLEIRERNGRRAVIQPVDYRLSELLSYLTQYQLELSQEANLVATELQRDVLTSILYSKKESTDSFIPEDFNKNEERNKLTSAYTQLKVIDAEVRKKITFHVEAVEKVVKEIHSIEKTEEDNIFTEIRSLEALQQTRTIIKLSLDAEKKTSKIFSQISLFIETLGSFIDDKKFEFRKGDLLIQAHDEHINYNALSSGEKQLLIILIETLLQRQEPYIFLTDEPELSLHIAWQRKIVPAIKKLNPNAQIIVATHSPEVAAKYKSSILDMKEIVNA